MAVTNVDKGYVFSANPSGEGKFWTVTLMDYSPIHRELFIVTNLMTYLASLESPTPTQSLALERAKEEVSQIDISATVNGISLSTKSESPSPLYTRLASYINPQKVVQLKEIEHTDKYRIMGKIVEVELDPEEFKFTLEEKTAHTYEAIESIRESQELLRLNHLNKKEQAYHRRRIDHYLNSLEEFRTAFPYHCVDIFYKGNLVFDRSAQGFQKEILHVLDKANKAAKAGERDLAQTAAVIEEKTPHYTPKTLESTTLSIHALLEKEVKDFDGTFGEFILNHLLTS